MAAAERVWRVTFCRGNARPVACSTPSHPFIRIARAARSLPDASLPDACMPSTLGESAVNEVRSTDDAVVEGHAKRITEARAIRTIILVPSMRLERVRAPGKAKETNSHSSRLELISRGRRGAAGSPSAALAARSRLQLPCPGQPIPPVLVAAAQPRMVSPKLGQQTRSMRNCFSFSLRQVARKLIRGAFRSVDETQLATREENGYELRMCATAYPSVCIPAASRASADRLGFTSADHRSGMLGSLEYQQ